MSELKRELHAADEFDDVSDVDAAEEQDAGKPLSRKDFRRQKRKRRRKVMLAVLPTMLTLGNGVCGLGAIAVAVSGAELGWPLEQKLFTSGMLIFGGMLFDALDGSAARMTGQETEFGAQLDSLCDAVTFGTAPAVIIWRISDALPQRFLWAVGVLFTLCVLIRLARFNVETDEDDSHETFEGLPSPAAAGTLAAFAIAMPDLKDLASNKIYPENVQAVADAALVGSHYFIPALAGVLAYLMVSRFQYPHLVAQWVKGRRTTHQIGQAMFALGGVFLLHWLALPIAFCYYSFAAPLRSLMRSRRSWMRAN
ncbi:CDP-alcohol phosphatidyltransferase family protein [Rhodopirellula sp. JC639]|uniref:CDP-alcohol phosphatidyltransferase family protein n=1 Tax=Stieleria mannarensis TaxID=2755585 RepID=UPI001602CBC2|nr:CDP-alcohol phosphatidyltransferase family protein [Rhodopirellula sp. JC639]